MNVRPVLRWMLWREFIDQRQNRMLWPVYLIMPLIGAALPALMAVASAGLLGDEALRDPQLAPMLAGVRLLAQAAGIDLTRAAAMLLMRVSAAYFLLMPLAIVSIAGAYAIVGEKQQRTLEPVLATPMSTAAFLLAKLIAVIVPAVLASWIAALIGAAVATASFRIAHGLWIWPDLFYWIAVFGLAPLIAALTALICLRVSARMQDPQAANQVTALILVPALLVLLGLIGPALVLRLSWLIGACVVFALLTWGVFVWVRRGFNREEILCRWN